MADFVRFRGQFRQDAVGIVRDTIRAVLLGGTRPDLAEMVLMPGAVALLSKIGLAFVEKARGGTDEAGIQWAQLKRETIARRRIGPGDLAAIGVKGTKIPANRTRGLLTPAEDARWRKIFATRLAYFRGQGMDDGAAKARSAQIAWATLKAQGAKTKLDVLGSRNVEIGRDTGILFRSLQPGLEANPDQVCEVEPGRITVGSNVPYAQAFHRRRPLWPTGGELPDPWTRAIAAALAGGLVRAIAQEVQSGRV